MPHSRKKVKNLTIASKNVVLMAFAVMPTDIILEIFGYVDPLDLLRLARTTKALRTILMSHSSSSLWKRVRRAYYEMPDSPEGMSEPQYISLALDQICDGCGHCGARPSLCYSNVYTYWNAQLKSCRKCGLALLANESNLKKVDLYDKGLPYWLRDLILEVPDKPRYSIKQAQIWSQEYASLRVNGSSANLEEWRCQIEKKHELTNKFSASFYFWLHKRKGQLMVRSINEALLDKLEEHGWGEEISKMSAYERSELHYTFSLDLKCGFRRDWSLKGPAILEALKAIQTVRIKTGRRMLLSPRFVVLQKIYDTHIRGFSPDSLVPNIADFALSPPIHAILTDEQTDFKVTRQTFGIMNIRRTFPAMLSNWKMRLNDELVRMVQVELSEPFTKDQLLLATTVFYCDACHMDLFYPQVLIHECPSPDGIFPGWNASGNIKFDRGVHQAAIDVINILGLDPKTVTADDTSVKNSELQCLGCGTTPQGRMTMIWSRAIEHSREEHHCLPSMISWSVVGDD